MSKYVTPELLERFVDMVSRLGPQPRLIQFFSAIASVHGEAVKANQESTFHGKKKLESNLSIINGHFCVRRLIALLSSWTVSAID